MRSRALTGTTVGSFDQLLVRSPAHSGPYEDILDLIGSGGGGGGGGPYDDTQIQLAVAANSAGMAALASSTATSLAGKQDVIQDGDLTIA